MLIDLMIELAILPRDVQIKILGKCDIETRIKGGIIGTLNVPFAVQVKISECLHQPECLRFDFGQTFYLWKLGRDNHPWLYTIIKEIDYKNKVMTSIYNRYCHYIIA
jgi:hypothetical protein